LVSRSAAYRWLAPGEPACRLARRTLDWQPPGVAARAATDAPATSTPIAISAAAASERRLATFPGEAVRVVTLN
jgi:hypothetical protein